MTDQNLPARQAALDAGLTTYHGKPCIRCGNDARFVNNRNCTECNKMRSRRYREEGTNNARLVAYRREHQPQATKTTREWRAAHPNQAREILQRSQRKRKKARRRYDLKRRYGLTSDKFDEMDKCQSGRCAICGDPWSAAPQIDHDHTTGKVRGLLCGRCNRAVGLLRDDWRLAEKAQQYLQAYDND